MKAQTLRTVIIQLDDIVNVHAALALLKNGKGLTALESGVVAEDPIADLSLVDQQVAFDGFYWTVFLFVTTG